LTADEEKGTINRPAHATVPGDAFMQDKQHLLFPPTLRLCYNLANLETQVGSNRMTQYAHPEVLVETEWLAEHLHDPSIRIIECDGSPKAYEEGHIEGAVFWNAYSQLQRSDLRINDDPAFAAELFTRSGITPENTVVIYSNSFSANGLAFWYLKYFGQRDVRMLNGGRKKWTLEHRPLTTAPAVEASEGTMGARPVRLTADPSIRAVRTEVEASIGQSNTAIVDTRRLQEYSGEWFASRPPEGTERAGHIPGAKHIYFVDVYRADGTFKPTEELRALYEPKGVTADKEVTTYCTLGWRAGSSWFVLKYLLGYPNVKNYDGSWNEWGRLPDTPIEAEQRAA
jgi:thiosulfate/3-mercaptopyruvate sulfurtransferase